MIPFVTLKTHSSKSAQISTLCPTIILGRTHLYRPHKRWPFHPISPPSGLPQDAVLSTTLFTRYIADIPHPPDTQLALYADDIAILSQFWRPETITRRLNSTLSQLLRYFNKWKLWVNISRTELILLTKRRPPDPQSLQFRNVTVPWSNTVKYLGLLLDSKLLFTKH